MEWEDSVRKANGFLAAMSLVTRPGKLAVVFRGSPRRKSDHVAFAKILRLAQRYRANRSAAHAHSALVVHFSGGTSRTEGPNFHLFIDSITQRDQAKRFIFMLALLTCLVRLHF